MMTKETNLKREQVSFFSMDDLVPQDHILSMTL